MTTKTKVHLGTILAAFGVAVCVVALSQFSQQDQRPEPTQQEIQQGLPSADVQPASDEPPQALFGYEPHPEESREFEKSLPKPTIRQAAPGLFNAIGDDDREVFLYRFLYDVYEEKIGGQWIVGRQGIGDCVSWGWAHGADIHLAVMYKRGDSADWKPVATESIYGGSRVEARGRSSGGWSDGSYGSAAAKWLRDYGLIFREKYDSVDLTTYSAKRAKDWGNYGNGGQGDNGKLDNEAKKSPVREITLVTNFDEAAAAIESGYPVPVCSMQGFASVRDKDGFARPSGSWAHCLLPGTMVHSLIPKECQEIAVNDLVVTHEGNFKPVKQVIVNDYDGPVTTLRTTGTLDVQATSNHPILVYRPIRKNIYPEVDLLTYGGGKLSYLHDAKAEHDKSQPIWIPISDAQRGDYVLTPVSMRRHGNSIGEWQYTQRAKDALPEMAPSDALAYLLGSYVANGNIVTSHKVVITVPSHADYVDKICDGFSELGLQAHVQEHETYKRVVAYNATLANSFKSWCGGNALEKRVPDFVFGEGWNWEAFLDGYAGGDGCEFRDGRTRITTISPVLANQVWQMTVATGQYPIMGLLPKHRSSYPNGKQGFYVEFGGEPKRKETRYWNGFYCCPVRESNASHYKGKVYNYEVEGDHSYLATGVVHHNCMVFIGVRHNPRPGLLCLNSWGPGWISGPKYPDDMPEGSFWVDKSTVNRMLAGRDSFAISGYGGFPFKPINHADWAVLRHDEETQYALAP